MCLCVVLQQSVTVFDPCSYEGLLSFPPISNVVNLVHLTNRVGLPLLCVRMDGNDIRLMVISKSIACPLRSPCFRPSTAGKYDCNFNRFALHGKWKASEKAGKHWKNHIEHNTKLKK